MIVIGPTLLRTEVGHVYHGPLMPVTTIILILIIVTIIILIIIIMIIINK